MGLIWIVRVTKLQNAIMEAHGEGTETTFCLYEDIILYSFRGDGVAWMEFLVPKFFGGQ